MTLVILTMMVGGCSLSVAKKPINITICSFDAKRSQAYCSDYLKNEVEIVPSQKLDKYFMISPQDFLKLESHYQELLLR